MRTAHLVLSLCAAATITAGLHTTAQAQCCEVYKSSWTDYTPQGLPDFDQKQSNWNVGSRYTHCGPVAVANCLWWFDSKLEPAPVDPRPFGVTPPNDGYPLLAALAAGDDHDTANVVPFVTLLASLMSTNGTGLGTEIDSLVSGTRQHLAGTGVLTDFSDTLVPYPTHSYIASQVDLGCNVILLLGLYEDVPSCCRVGGHYVTVAGACTSATEICVSDPWLDALEGEPPAGSAHGAGEHNNADFISGPHSQIQHDTYTLTAVNQPCLGMTVETIDYSIDLADRTHFEGQNGEAPCAPQGIAAVFWVVEYAYVICPSNPTDVGSQGEGVQPNRFGLGANYPNPFNAQTAIDYSISEPGFVSLVIYNALGQQVRSLAAEHRAAGIYRTVWDGRDQAGEDVPSGIYFYRLQAGVRAETRKMLLLK